MVLDWVGGGECQAPAAECHACPPGKETQHTLCTKRPSTHCAQRDPAQIVHKETLHTLCTKRPSTHCAQRDPAHIVHKDTQHTLCTKRPSTHCAQRDPAHIVHKETQHTLCMKLDRFQVKKILLPLVLEPQTAQTMVSHYTMFSRLPNASGYYKVTVRSGGYGH